MNKYAKSLILAGFLLTLAGQVEANCPEPRELSFSCIIGPDRVKHCAWSAPWYEGYQDDTGSPSEHVTFIKAYWKSNSNLKTDYGSTVCLYLTSRGTLINLSQNTWGGVPFPGGNWNPTIWENKPVYACVSTNTYFCRFKYPN